LDDGLCERGAVSETTLPEIYLRSLLQHDRNRERITSIAFTKARSEPRRKGFDPVANTWDIRVCRAEIGEEALEKRLADNPEPPTVLYGRPNDLVAIDLRKNTIEIEVQREIMPDKGLIGTGEFENSTHLAEPKEPAVDNSLPRIPDATPAEYLTATECCVEVEGLRFCQPDPVNRSDPSA
jgi:hypothetical protein